MWYLKKFSELSTRELYNILYVRVQTFVVEQERFYQEVDSIDLTALHLFKTNEQGIVAYARVFVEKDHVTFGRILITPQMRGLGLGRELLEQTLEVVKIHFPNYPIQIEAQVQVVSFYERFGFKSSGNIFSFNHTPHQLMVHRPLV